MHKTDLQESNIKQKHLNYFKTLTMLFAFSTVGAFFASFINPLLVAIVNYGGTILLIIGIFLLAKNYSELSSGMKVVILFAIGILIHVLSALFNYFYPIPTIDPTNPQNNLQTVVNSFYLHAPFISAIFIINGIITFIIAYYFTKWFNSSFANYNPTKSFYYYGLAYGLGSVITGLGTYIFALSLINIDLSHISQYSNQILPGLTLFAIGSVIIYFSVFLQILAGFKIYNRANDKALGKVPFNIAQESSNQQPILNSFQKTVIPSFNKSHSKDGDDSTIKGKI